uniref:(northern house mosquito) hypothetical protein n=1 Tax=Culex pipiens TaxID=7175 RepID=A0A8D8AJK0_CULPI
MFEGSYFFFVFVASSNKKKSTSSPPPWCDKVTQSEENRLFHACFNRRASDRVALLTFHFLPGPITIGSDRVFRSDLLFHAATTTEQCKTRRFDSRSHTTTPAAKPLNFSHHRQLIIICQKRVLNTVNASRHKRSGRALSTDKPIKQM